MTADDLPAVMVLEEELFAPDTWTAAMYRDELARPTPGTTWWPSTADAASSATPG